MKRFLLLTLLPIVAFAAGPAPYPVSVNSQSPVVTALQSYQANERTFRVTFKDGTNAVDLTGYTPRMTWATTNTATSVATSSWAYVVSSTSGVVDFTFTPASMNTNGVFIYEVGVAGLPLVYRQGSFTIISSPMGNGAAALTFTNPASYVATVGSQVTGIGFDQSTGAAVLTGSVASAGVLTGNQNNAIVGGLTISNVLQWGTNPASSTAIGASFWSTTYGTKVVNMGFTNLDGTPVMNEEGFNSFVLVQNRSGITISNGAVVAIIPHNASMLAVVPAIANGSATNSYSIVGMMTHELVNNAIGVANSFGEVGGLNTAAWIEGTHVFLSTNGNGTLTTNYVSEGQTSPFHIGYVSRSHATQGRIWVDIGHHEDDPHWASVSNSISQRIASNETAIASKLATNGVQAGGLGGVLITNAGGIVYVSATNTGGGGGSVTNGQWLPDVYAVGVTASGALQKTGGTMSSQLNINVSAGLTLVQDYVARMWRASNGEIDFIVETNIAENVYVQYENSTDWWKVGTSNDDFVLYRVTAGTGTVYIAPGLTVRDGPIRGNGSGITNITGLAGKLDSNVWAEADSTTNYVARTGGLYGLNSTATWTFAFGDQSGLFDLQPTRATILLTSSGSGWVQLETNAFSVRGSTVFAGDGSGLTAINGAAITNLSAGASLTTNAVIKLPAMRGFWDVSSDVPTSGGGAMAFEQPFSTSTVYRASFRTISTAAVSRVIQGAPVALSSVETNWVWFDIDHVGTNAATIQFTAAGATNVLFSQNLTTTGVYRVNGTNAAGNRELVPYLYTTNTGPGTTNFSRTWIPVIRAVVQ